MDYDDTTTWGDKTVRTLVVPCEMISVNGISEMLIVFSFVDI